MYKNVWKLKPNSEYRRTLSRVVSSQLPFPLVVLQKTVCKSFALIACVFQHICMAQNLKWEASNNNRIIKNVSMWVLTYLAVGVGPWRVQASVLWASSPLFPNSSYPLILVVDLPSAIAASSYEVAEARQDLIHTRLISSCLRLETISIYAVGSSGGEIN